MEIAKLVPFVATKVLPWTVLSDANYQSLFGVLNMVDKIVTACVGVGSSKPTASLVAAAVHGYRTVLYAYLAEKENIVLPMLRAFFTPQEVFAGEFPSKSQTVCPYSYQKGLLPLHIQDC
jgi:hypothetical protein